MPRTLKGRLVLFLVGAVLLTWGSAAVTERVIHAQRLEVRAEERARLLTRNVLEVMFQAMRHADRTTVDDVLASAGHHNGLDHLRVVAPDGRVAFSTHRDELGSVSGLPPERMSASRVITTLERRGEKVLATVVEPIANDARCGSCHAAAPASRGVFEVGLDVTRTAAALDAGWWSLVGVLAGALTIVAALLWWFARSFLLAPLGRLLASIRRVGAGRLDERVDLDAPLELSEVGAEFNAMVERLEQAKAQLDRRYEHRLERADRLATVGELATALAHEIQNPLAGLSGALQVMSKDPTLADRREILDEMLGTIGRLSKSVGDLLGYARPRSPDPAHLDVGEVVRNVVLLLRQQQGEGPEVRIVEDLHPSPLDAWADPEQLRQVLLNLSLNALQAMPEGGELRLRTAPAGDGRVRIEVSDTGVGIPEAELEQVFRPFFTTKPKGTGLGLAITRGIVERCGGIIGLTSRLGEGTTVRIELPLQSPETQPLTPPRVAAGGG